MVKNNIKYWLCCGSVDPMHKDKRAKNCMEAMIGFPHHCRFGTAEEHSEWSKNRQKEKLLVYRQGGFYGTCLVAY